MSKSKNGKNHKQRLAKYKANKKKEQEFFKKKLIDNYIKAQQQALAEQESHTSTQEVEGPEVNIDELNQMDEVPSIEIDNAIIDNTESNDNNNQ
jgi:hypothetical protein